jgi:hypothetical protein
MNNPPASIPGGFRPADEAGRGLKQTIDFEL